MRREINGNRGVLEVSRAAWSSDPVGAENNVTFRLTYLMLIRVLVLLTRPENNKDVDRISRRLRRQPRAPGPESGPGSSSHNASAAAEK